jgi:hypothetical protein
MNAVKNSLVALGILVGCLLVSTKAHAETGYGSSKINNPSGDSVHDQVRIGVLLFLLSVGLAACGSGIGSLAGSESPGASSQAEGKSAIDGRWQGLKSSQ